MIRRESPENIRHLLAIPQPVLLRWYAQECPGSSKCKSLFMVGEDAGSCLRIISNEVSARYGQIWADTCSVFSAPTANVSPCLLERSVSASSFSVPFGTSGVPVAHSSTVSPAD